jgi:antitoxin component of MazEF toxin-antitoxin module
MQIVKIRKVGNSNAVTLPRDLEAQGYTEGTEVMVDVLPTGELLVMPAAKVREYVRMLARQAIEDNREALDILEAYDRA